MSDVESVLVAALVANHVPDVLISGTVSALTADFSHSKEVASLLEQIIVSATEKDVVTNLMLEVKMVPTLPPGLLALFGWLMTPEVTPVQFEEVLNAVEVAIVGNESWFVKVNPFA